MFHSFIKLKHPFQYITELHKTKVSFLSQNLSKVQCRMNSSFINLNLALQAAFSTQSSNSWANLTLYFRCQCFWLNISKHLCSELFKFCSSAVPVLSWSQVKPKWLVAVFKGLGVSQGLVFNFYTWTKPTNKLIKVIALAFT